ncbi:RING finger containing protein [Sarcoptes scabiei]|uniref:RING finger containing protein n=1 Tax=Sarcoptes scabiei TaxID=52283 RepID=A0A132AE05_SARSC|nr:RING finger containing protein [Sarcoptes scabiei]
MPGGDSGGDRMTLTVTQAPTNNGSFMFLKQSDTNVTSLVSKSRRSAPNQIQSIMIDKSKNGHIATGEINNVKTSTGSSSSSLSSSTSKIDQEERKFVKDLNEFISCYLCKGYLIDATTIIECLHSFCKTCILKYFDDNNNPKAQSCPKCLKQVHSTKPKVNIRSDPTLQDIVYKLVPGLFKNEMMRRKEYFMRYPEKASGLSNEEKGEMNGERLILSTDDYVQITIEYFPEVTNPYKLLPFNNNENLEIQLDNLNQRRYLLCKAGMRVLHLKKFIRSKYELESNVPVDFFYKHELLEDNYTIMDLAYIYSWRRQIPIPLYYLILEPDKTRDDYLCKK